MIMQLKDSVKHFFASVHVIFREQFWPLTILALRHIFVF